ncbi:MAG: NAD(P)-dependent oxidoreductase [Acidobacteriota bacterium]|nr:NAD(P)-dependent oxidoreductase [Acidobacteriota bacterium]
MSALVTGASGLIGRHLVNALARREDVWASSRTVTGHPSIEGVRSVAWNLRQPDPPAVLPDQVDTVFHLAQSGGYRDFPEQAADVFDVNVASTARLLDWSRHHGVTRFVLASSGGVESQRGFYLASKRSAELLAASYESIFTVIIIRFFFVYGRGQRPTMLIPRLVDHVRNGRPVVLDGVDGMRLNPVHVSDAVAALERVTALDASATLDLAGPDILTIRDLCEIIGSQVGRSPVFTAGREAPRDLIGDIRQMSARLCAPVVPFTKGVQDFCHAGADALKP